MHRIDAADYVVESGKNKFSDGDPTVPRLPTVLSVAWLNDVQEELAELVTTCGVQLLKGTAQLKNLIVNTMSNQTVLGVKTFVNSLVGRATTEGAYGVVAEATTGVGKALQAVASLTAIEATSMGVDDVTCIDAYAESPGGVGVYAHANGAGGVGVRTHAVNGAGAALEAYGHGTASGAEVTSDSGVPLFVIGNTVHGHIRLTNLATLPSDAVAWTIALVNGSLRLKNGSGVWETISTIS